MIEGLDGLLAGSLQPALPELRGLVAELLGGADAEGRVVGHESLRHARVQRLRFELAGSARSLIAKRLPLDRSHREQMVIQRWLPEVGLPRCGPPLLGVVAARAGRCVWHVYEDLGDCSLDRIAGDHVAVAAAVDLVARVHAAFASHPILGECRSQCGERGTSFYRASLRDAVRCLEAVNTAAPERAALRARLRAHLQGLLDEEPDRAAALSEHGGPETLLHGDLWTMNVLVPDPSDGPLRLVDWDRAGVGPVAYDLSTFLLRFPPSERRWIVERYRETAHSHGRSVPSAEELAPALDSAERARLASALLCPALAASQGAEWAFEDLAEIDRWFEALEPVLPAVELAESPEAPWLAS